MHKDDPMKYVHNILKRLAFQMSHGQNFPPIESQKHWPIVIGDKVHPFFSKIKLVDQGFQHKRVNWREGIRKGRKMMSLWVVKMVFLLKWGEPGLL